MGVKVKTKTNNIPKTIAVSNRLNGKTVEVGVFGGEQEWLAAIHEFGCNIPVTPEMRAFLRYNGLYLKASTTEIVIPERSFLRAGFDERYPDMREGFALLALGACRGMFEADAVLCRIGEDLSAAIKAYATSKSDPPNHPFTVARKNRSNPLVDSGDMIGSITFQVKG